MVQLYSAYLKTFQRDFLSNSLYLNTPLITFTLLAIAWVPMLLERLEKGLLVPSDESQVGPTTKATRFVLAILYRVHTEHRRGTFGACSILVILPQLCHVI